jgi:hypothetical protein
VVFLVVVLQAAAPAMTSATVTLSSALLVAGGALLGVFLRRAGIGAPLFDTAGWRWLDPGAVLYLASGLCSFVVLFLLMDAEGMPVVARELAGLVVLMVPAGTAWAIQPMRGEP